ncbi:SusC/RagA family TonB-linked outer membrane protein [Maribellus comscasis]|uniref:SusC/RagA family TonB-linked outer membrane protein n=1 Tax=Maribellus comscasis TaxID=2681766 RepID=A0A6I6JML3_9BACT|nr:TonB-dependent receptor [Maribellus comscasis]QGY43641.1 SusC/RagA family TonB-linked outer membrane protein [Maribellus comscasis]
MQKLLTLLMVLFVTIGSAMAQKEISGTVTSEGVPLPGVTVFVKGSTIGSVTDVDGNYNLSVPDDATTLVFSFIGMKTQEVEIGNQSNIGIDLEPDVIGLGEVIAVGYGTMRKSDLTGSVARVSMEDKALQADLNILQSLSGASAGINVQQTGAAGGEPDFSVRGQTSLSASDRPLIVLDGIIYNGDIADINVSDVESIDILKDASAAAVYGSRSANGVVLITTKSGTTEKPQVEFSMYYGFQDMTNTPMKVMNAEQYAIRLTDYYYQQDLYTWYATNPTSDAGKPVRPDITNREVVASTLRTQEERDNYLAGNEIDWVDEVTQIAPIQSYNLSYSGNTGRTNYYVSGSYANEEGILVNDKFSRFTVRSNIESTITDWLKVGLNSAYSYRDYSGLSADLDDNTILSDARNCSPLANNHIGQPDYDMYLTGEAYMPYPLIHLYADNSDLRNNLFMVGSANIKIPWIKGLSFDINYSNTYYTRNNFTFFPVTHYDGAGNNGAGSKYHYEERSWIQNNILTYLRDFGDHNVNATFLYSREHSGANASTLSASGFENQQLSYNGLGLGTLSTVSTSAWEEDGISYMGRLSYSYKNRYYLTGTVRRDGYSGFGANNKFANFPSLSLGWVLSEEDFVGSSFPYMKLRVSYGINGNQGLGRYKSFSTMTTLSYIYDAETSIGLYPSGSLGNDDLKWEKTASLNMGVDFAFLNQRISGSLDLYNANTTDVLVQRALPATAGYDNVYTNIGGINNKGIEIMLNTINMEQSDFRWSSNFTFSLNRNEITKLYGDENDADIGNEWFVGESISAQYDYEMAGGLWTEEELYSGQILDGWYPGQFKYVDQNEDGVIDPTNDRKVIGYEDPNFRFSINNSLSYKNFSLNFLLNAICGGNGYYIMDNAGVLNTKWRSDDVYRTNMSAVRQYWTPDNGVNNATGIYNSPAVSSGIYQSRGFIRLQDISLAYKFNDSVLNRLKINNLQVYVSGKNLYTWTKWSGWDPETGTSNTPLMRNITVGVKISL